MKVSIITTSFNQASFLQKNLDSVDSQLYKNYEHIILDPGSTDESRALIKKYASSNPRVKAILEPDRGQVDAINKGLAIATGDILTWINSDDYYDNNSVLQDVVSFFQERSDLDVVYGRGLRVDEHGNKLSEAFVHPDGTDFKESLKSSIGILQPSLFFKREVFENVGGLDEAYNLQLDYEYWIRIAKENYSFGKINKILSRATVHSDAKSTGQRKEQLNECFFLLEKEFGTVDYSWIDRYAEFYATGMDRKVSKQIEKPKRTKMIEAAVASSLSSKLGIESPASVKVIATAFDSKYFNQGLNLIASLHRTSFVDFDKIIVYPLCLEASQLNTLKELEKVEIKSFPSDIEEAFEGFLDPKHRAYKSFIIKDMSDGLKTGDMALWMDAGLSCMESIDSVFSLIDEHDFFIPDHDDKDSWPFYNINFTHPQAAKLLDASVEELLAPHLCSCLVGYKVNGKYQQLIEDARKLGAVKDIVVWPKVPDKKYKAKLDREGHRLKNKLLQGDIEQSLTYESIRKLFDYYGHRTQCIYSILAFRYNAPSFSGKIYRMSNDISSQASVRNWKSSATDTDANSSRFNLEGVTKNVKIYHHRGVYHNLDGMKYRGCSRPLIIMGNGPSLAKVPFESLFQFDTLGMNAAYRFWDEKGVYPTYYCCMDTVVLESHKDEVFRLIKDRIKNGIKKFFLRKCFLDWFPQLVDDESIVYLEDVVQEELSFFDMEMITTGSYSLLWAVFLGYRDINILGVDLNYVEKIEGAELKKGRILEIEDDKKNNPNYFFDGYQQKGDKFNPPNPHPNLHVRSWNKVAKSLEGLPLTVRNLNPESLVKDFEFKDAASFFKEYQKCGKEFEFTAFQAKNSLLEGDFWRRQTINEIERCIAGESEVVFALKTLSARTRKWSESAGEGKHFSLYDEVFEKGWHEPSKVKGKLSIFTKASEPASLDFSEIDYNPKRSIIVIKIEAAYCKSMLESLVITDDLKNKIPYKKVNFSDSLFVIAETQRKTKISLEFNRTEKPNKKDHGLKIGGLYILSKSTMLRHGFPLSHFDAPNYARRNEDAIKRVLSGESLSLFHDYLKHDAKTIFIAKTVPLLGYRFELSGN